MKIMRCYSIERKNGALQLSGSQQFANPPHRGKGPGRAYHIPTDPDPCTLRSAVLTFLKGMFEGLVRLFGGDGKCIFFSRHYTQEV